MSEIDSFLVNRDQEVEPAPPVRPPRHKNGKSKPTSSPNHPSSDENGCNKFRKTSENEKVKVKLGDYDHRSSSTVNQNKTDDGENGRSSPVSSPVYQNNNRENNDPAKLSTCPLVVAENVEENENVFFIESTPMVIKNNELVEKTGAESEAVILDVEHDGGIKSLSNRQEIVGKKRLWCVPWIMIFISLVQILVYGFIPPNSQLFNQFLFSPYQKEQLWRYVSYSLLHLNKFHLFTNVVLQLLIALPLETEQGRARVIYVYYGGVIAGALSSMIFQPTLLMIGASAGVYSILFSHFPHIMINFRYLRFRIFRIFALFVLIVGDIFYLIQYFLTMDNTSPKIGFAAHIIGGISGILLGFTFYVVDTKKQSTVLRIIKYLCLSIYLIAILVVVLINLEIFIL